MIKIEKGPAPAFMTDPAGLWRQETERAIIYYANPANTKAFEFKMYNHERVKEELKKYFVKCAYCESKYASSSDGDIEHFRPKGRVIEKEPSTPGYYWLANDWDNLLLSCQHCNQGRKHKLYNHTSADGTQKFGKVDQFPLMEHGVWLSSPTGLVSTEEPYRLLLNPCVDSPDQHFDYEDTNAVMVPKTEMAKISIKVYALRRRFLVQERMEVFFNLRDQLDAIKFALEDYAADGSERNQNKLKVNWRLALNFTLPEARYAGMARYFVKKFLEKHKIKTPV